MKFKTSVVTIAVLFASVALGLAWKSARFNAKTDAALAALEPKAIVLRSEIARLETQLTAAQKPDQLAAPTKPPAADAIATQTILAQLNMEEKNPRLQALYLKSIRAQTRTAYSPLYRHLQLTSNQTVSFEEITFQRDEKVNDLMAAARSLGLAMDDPSIRELLTDAQDNYNAQMKSLLGEAAYPELQQYDRTLWLRRVVSGIAGVATIAGVPFTSSQTERLVSIIANTSPRYVQGGTADTNTVDWEIIDAQAQTVLSKEQFEAFTTLEASNSGRFLAKLHGTIIAAKKADAEQAARSPQK